MKLPARLLAALLALAGLISPGAAGAATHHRAHAHHAGPSYPMKADEFRALMEKRIDGVRAVIDRKLDRRGVSADRKKAIHKIFDEASHDLRAEIARAAADGTVTQNEADKVKALAAGLRGKVRERLRAEKDPHAKDKIAKEEAAQKEKAERAAHKEKAEKAAQKEKAAEAPVKAAKTDAAPAAKPHKATKTAKKAGPTKTAKSAPAKKHKSTEADSGAPAGDPGQNL